MRLVTRLTGLSADTIRAWERRYGAIEPRRSAGNTRRFSAEDVRRLVLLRDATSRGHTISSIASLSVAELEKLAGGGGAVGAPSKSAEPGPSTLADRGLEELRRGYLEAVARFDARKAYEILMRAATFLDRRELVFGMIVPLVQDVGSKWSFGELGIAQEHMVSSQIRSVVSSLLRFAPPRPDAPQLLMTTPPGHRHELGILVAALLTATKGLDPLYLGPDLPFEELRWALEMSAARIVVLSVVRDMTPAELQALPVFLEQLPEDVEVWLGVPAEHPLTRMVHVTRLFHDFETFDRALEVLG
jgi:DNA-binding transcriptional MerR regulator